MSPRLWDPMNPMGPELPINLTMFSRETKRRVLSRDRIVLCNCKTFLTQWFLPEKNPFYKEIQLYFPLKVINLLRRDFREAASKNAAITQRTKRETGHFLHGLLCKTTATAKTSLNCCYCCCGYNSYNFILTIYYVKLLRVLQLHILRFMTYNDYCNVSYTQQLHCYDNFFFIQTFCSSFLFSFPLSHLLSRFCPQQTLGELTWSFLASFPQCSAVNRSKIQDFLIIPPKTNAHLSCGNVMSFKKTRVNINFKLNTVK